jgi:hypothetical protein
MEVALERINGLLELPGGLYQECIDRCHPAAIGTPRPLEQPETVGILSLQ